jgi:uncharacterized protein YqeY
MSLRQRLADEMKDAMKSRAELKLSVIRMVRSAVKNRDIEQRQELNDQEICEVIASSLKQRRESVRMFKEAGRDDLVAKEEQELSILLDFLPQQLSREEVAALVDKTIAESGAESSGDMGKVMKLLMPQLSGRADGKLVSDLVRAKLG